MDLSIFLQNYGSLLISILSILISGLALYVTYRASYSDRLNANGWATYEAYNSERVRAGRAAARNALRAKKDGFANKKEYDHHFLHSASTPEEDQDLKQQEQYLHDLMAFYHQVGLLLKKQQVDKDFILLMLGAGLHDRWALLSKVPTFFEDHTKPEGDFPYGGMYLLHEAYLVWQERRFAKLKRQFKQALERAQTQTSDEAEKQRQAVALTAGTKQPPKHKA
ncbi:MAG TPA: hypothetical protein VH593_00480 [Ktedonobacteraceae bacterium]